MGNEAVKTETCPIELTVRFVGNKWKLLILRELFRGGRMRFNELHRAIRGVTQKALSEKLKQMERDGLVIRTAFSEVPPRVEYSLSPLGRSLRSVMSAIYSWGNEYMTSGMPEEE